MEHDGECEHGEVALRVGRRMNCTRAEMSELLNVQSVELCFCALRGSGEWKSSTTDLLDLVSVGVLRVKGERDRLRKMAISSSLRAVEEGREKVRDGKEGEKGGESEEGGLVIFVDFKKRRKQ